MYSRNINLPQNLSFFLFGPRGTGKSSHIKRSYPNSIYIDLLESGIYIDLLADPSRVESYFVGDTSKPIIIDEIQRIPELLNEVHRLIESHNYNFIMTGSSSRKLRKGGSNLLAGRALKYNMFPMTAAELGTDFNLEQALRNGMLPSLYDKNKNELPATKYLESYVEVYLQEEILQEGLSRNLAAFSPAAASATASWMSRRTTRAGERSLNPVGWRTCPSSSRQARSNPPSSSRMGAREARSTSC